MSFQEFTGVFDPPKSSNLTARIIFEIFSRKCPRIARDEARQGKAP